MNVRIEMTNRLEGRIAYRVDSDKAPAIRLSPALPSLHMADPIFLNYGTLAPSRSKPYFDLIVSFEEHETPSVLEAIDLSEALLRAQGITGSHLYVIAPHADARLRHVHNFACRFDPRTAELSPHPKHNEQWKKLSEVARTFGYELIDNVPTIGKGARQAETWNGRKSFVRTLQERFPEGSLSDWGALLAGAVDAELDVLEGRRGGIVFVDRSGARPVYASGSRIGLTPEILASWGARPALGSERSAAGAHPLRYGELRDRNQLEIVPELLAHPLFNPFDPRHNPKRLGEELRRGAWRDNPNPPLAPTDKEPLMHPDSPRIGPAPAPQPSLSPKEVQRLFRAHLRATINRQDMHAEFDRIERARDVSRNGSQAAAAELRKNPMALEGHRDFAKALRAYGRTSRNAAMAFAINEYALGKHESLSFGEFLARLERDGRIAADDREAMLTRDAGDGALTCPDWSQRRVSTGALAGLRSRIDDEHGVAIYFDEPNPRIAGREDLFSLDREGFFRLAQPLSNQRAKESMLLAAAEMYGNRISITDGKETSRRELAELAGRLGIEVANPELQQAWQQGVEYNKRAEQAAAKAIEQQKTETGLNVKPKDIHAALSEQLAKNVDYFGASRIHVLSSKDKSQTIEARYVDSIRAGNRTAVLAIGADRTLYALVDKEPMPEVAKVAAREGELLRIYCNEQGVQTIDRAQLDEMQAEQRQHVQEQDIAQEVDDDRDLGYDGEQTMEHA